MLEFRKAIEQRGKVLNSQVVKVDTFLNHMIDPELLKLAGKEFANHFKDKGITKIITIESGGIAPALMTAIELDVPMIYAKKTKPSTMEDPVVAVVYSFTKEKHYTICMEREAMIPGDKVLFIDDFLANGEAFKGIEEFCRLRDAELVGTGICISKNFQKGRPYIEKKGYDLYTLAAIEGFKDGKIVWDFSQEQE